MTDPPPDEVRFLLNTLKWLRDEVELQLLERGWIPADVDVSDDEPLEWFWPPTAPVGYGGLPDWGDELMQRRPQLYGPRQTPWTHPTRITKAVRGWRLEYGEAVAQKPARRRDYNDNSTLIADLERIESWPLSVDETRRIQNERLVYMVGAFARDDHFVAMNVTEPYASRINALRAHRSYEQARILGLESSKPPDARPRGDLTAHFLLIDSEAWASAVRTARAGGEGWGPSGRV